MSFLDSTVVNVALPTIQEEYQADLSSTVWVVDAYVLTLTACILLGGSFGESSADGAGSAWASRLHAGSILCGLAPTLLR